MRDQSSGSDKQRVYSIILLDIDHFKNFNDTYGHDAGDSVLVTVVETVTASVRKQDMVFRYGGEEFIVFLPATGEWGAAEVGEKIRSTIASTTFSLPNVTQDLQITISAGVAAAVKGKHFDDVVKDADTKLYHAKETGRNRVVVSDQIRSTCEGCYPTEFYQGTSFLTASNKCSIPDCARNYLLNRKLR